MVFALQSVSCLDMGRNKLPLAISIHFLYKSLLIGSQLFFVCTLFTKPDRNRSSSSLVHFVLCDGNEADDAALQQCKKCQKKVQLK